MLLSMTPGEEALYAFSVPIGLAAVGLTLAGGGALLSIKRQDREAKRTKKLLSAGGALVVAAIVAFVILLFVPVHSQMRKTPNQLPEPASGRGSS